MIRKRWEVTRDYKDICSSIMQDNLASLRAKAALTQEELANIIGCSRQTYYAVESKQKELSWGMFLALSFFYHNLQATSDMWDDLKIYPIELFSKFNETVDVDL